jgi:hypothetical protein
VLTVAALAALVTVVVRHIDVTAGLFGLALLAMLPWLPGIVEQIEWGTAGFRLSMVKRRLDEQAAEINEQRHLIDSIVVYSMAWYLFETLQALYHHKRSGVEYLFLPHMDPWLRWLRDHGYLEQFEIRSLTPGENLIGKANLTRVGEYVVEMREKLSRHPVGSGQVDLKPAPPG